MVSYFIDRLILGEEGGVGRGLFPVLKFKQKQCSAMAFFLVRVRELRVIL